MSLGTEGNGGPPADHYDDDDMGETVTVAIQQQIRDIAKTADDIRASVATMGVQQAVTTGEVKVLATKLDGFEERIEPRIAALEVGRSRDEWRAWAERLFSGAGLAAAFELARHLLSK